MPSIEIESSPYPTTDAMITLPSTTESWVDLGVVVRTGQSLRIQPSGSTVWGALFGDPNYGYPEGSYPVPGKTGLGDPPPVGGFPALADESADYNLSGVQFYSINNPAFYGPYATNVPAYSVAFVAVPDGFTPPAGRNLVDYAFAGVTAAERARILTWEELRATNPMNEGVRDHLRLFAIFNDDFGQNTDNVGDFTLLLHAYTPFVPFMPSGPPITPSYPASLVDNPADDDPASDPAYRTPSAGERFQCVLTSFDRSLYYGVPNQYISAARWSKEQFGGYGQSSLELTGTAQELGFDPETDLAGWARVEFWVDGVCDYSGFITRPARSVAAPALWSLVGAGLYLLAGNRLMEQNFAYGDPKDLSEQTADLTFAARLRDAYPWLQVVTTPCGVTRQFSRYKGKTFQDAMNGQVEASANTAAWGFYHSEQDYTAVMPAGQAASMWERPDTLEFYPVSSPDAPDHAIPVPLTGITVAKGEVDKTKAVTVLALSGGPRQFPQLVDNGEFSRPANAGGGAGNLILNGDFETPSGSDGADQWSGTGSRRPAGPAESDAFSGSAMMELDRVNEYMEQTRTGITLTQGGPLRLQWRERLENQTKPNDYDFLFEWIATDGTRVTEITGNYGLTLAGWNIREFPITCPSIVGKTYHGFHIKFERTTDYTVGFSEADGQGIHIDLVELYDAEGIVQDGWEIITDPGVKTFGVYTDVPVLTDSRWDIRDSAPVDGSGYCVYVDGTAYDFDNANLILQMTNFARYTVRGGEENQGSVYLKRPPWTPSGEDSPVIELQLHGWRADGSSKGFNRKHIPSGALDSDANALAAGGTVAGNGWYRFTLLRHSDQDETQGSVRVALRGTGRFLADCVSVRNSQATDWCPAGDYSITIRCDDSRLDYVGAGLSGADITAVEAAILPEWQGGFGEQTRSVTVQSIVTDTDALGYAARLFAAPILDMRAPRITWEGPWAGTFFKPGQAVILVGEQGDALCGGKGLVITRVDMAWASGRLTADLDLRRERKDEASWFLELINRRLLQQEAQASAPQPGQATPTVGMGGGSWVQGPAYFGTIPYSSTDDTLHDDYTPPTGPHILASERTAWQGTTEEVTAARSSATNGPFTSLDDRLEYIETHAPTVIPTGAWVPLANGDPVSTELVWDGLGDVVMVWVDPVV